MNLSIFISLTVFSSIVSCSFSAGAGCTPVIIAKGLRVDYYDNVKFNAVPFGSSSVSDVVNYLGVIAGMKVSATKYGITNINFNVQNIPTDGDNYRNLYGRRTNYRKFGLRLSGYFYAPQNGKYTFAIDNIDDSAVVKIGSTAGGCCGTPSTTAKNYQLLNYGTINQDQSKQRKSDSTTLKKGKYYPIEIIYYNQAPNGAVLELDVTYPDGKKKSPGFFYQLSNKPRQCITTTIRSVSYWTNSYTSTHTYTPTKGGNATIVVDKPPLETTISWSESFTSTYTTTPVSGGPPLIVVETPVFPTLNPHWQNTTQTTTSMTTTMTTVPCDDCEQGFTTSVFNPSQVILPPGFFTVTSTMITNVPCKECEDGESISTIITTAIVSAETDSGLDSGSGSDVDSIPDSNVVSSGDTSPNLDSNANTDSGSNSPGYSNSGEFTTKFGIPLTASAFEGGASMKAISSTFLLIFSFLFMV
ncbi:hypothetical protein CLIB1444_26S00166 [[Candida] jaroonii]|uniref:Uncharacterized protein n=1 Tax=[Candida] jaroonii TaxID=467808 RepID=A0ACA9YFY6_9ASCO|nr:hypothetical protein CLIB1444_26S00166 [[Candida] jaroonii]